MIRLPRALAAWPSPAFRDIAKEEIQQLDAAHLPLQQGLSQSSYACTESFNAIIIGVTEGVDSILVKAGIFYTGMIPGCGCADDPTPVEEYGEYCEVQFCIDRTTAEAVVTLLTDDGT